MPFQIIREDITKMKVDAIVNSANPKARVGMGLDSAVYMRAGWKKLFEKRREIGDIPVGHAVYTEGGDLPANYIIHAVGPQWQGGMHGERKLLKSCYDASLHLAVNLKCKSVAFPMISTGNYGFPKDEALQIALSSISSFLMQEDMMVWLVVYDRLSADLCGKLFTRVDEYIDDHYVDTARHELFEAISEARLDKGEEPGANGLPRPAWYPEAYRRKEKASHMPVGSASLPCEQESGAFTASDDLDDILHRSGETFSQKLFSLIDERGLDDVVVYKKANISRKVFSKIRSNKYHCPRKNTVLALAIAMELSLAETEDLLKRAGYALSPSNITDLIVQYYILHRVYDLYEINLCLFEHDQTILGQAS